MKPSIGIALPVCPRPSGDEYYLRTLETLPDWPIVCLSRIGPIDDPRIVETVYPPEQWPQLEGPLNPTWTFPHSPKKYTWGAEYDRWRSQLVLDVALILEAAASKFDFVLWCEDDVEVYTKQLDDWCWSFLDAHAKGGNEYFDAELLNCDWLFILLHWAKWSDMRNPGGCMRLFCGAKLPVLVEELRKRFDERPCDVLIDQILVERKWRRLRIDEPLGKHIGSYSTLGGAPRPVG